MYDISPLSIYLSVCLSVYLPFLSLPFPSLPFLSLLFSIINKYLRIPSIWDVFVYKDVYMSSEIYTQTPYNISDIKEKYIFLEWISY